ncbi:MAG: TlpA disulfide reductase family protein [Bacteroidota bacterium]
MIGTHYSPFPAILKCWPVMLCCLGLILFSCESSSTEPSDQALHSPETPPTKPQLSATVLKTQLPSLMLKQADGHYLHPDSLFGKVVLVDFWASWCRPCREAQPELKILYEQYTNQGFEIVGVSVDQSKKAWLSAVKEDGLAWPQVIDSPQKESSIAQEFEINFVPVYLLLDKEGNLIKNRLTLAEVKTSLAQYFQAASSQTIL